MTIIKIKDFCRGRGGGGVSRRYEVAAGHGYRAKRGVGREFRAIILISDILYHPCSNKSLS